MDYTPTIIDAPISIDELLRQDSPEVNVASELCAVLLNMPPALVARVFATIPGDMLRDVLDAARSVNTHFADNALTYRQSGHADVLLNATPVQLCRWIDHLCRLSIAGVDTIFQPIIQHGTPASLHNLSMRARANEYWHAYDWLAQYTERNDDMAIAIARSLEYVPRAIPRKPHSLVPDHNPAPGMCIICYGDLTQSTTLPCGHRFDLVCIAEWYEKQTGEPTCPVCRAPFGAKK